MTFVQSVYLAALAVAAATSFLLAAHSLNYWGQRSVDWFTGMTASLGLWAAAAFFQTAVDDPGATLLWTRILYVGVVGAVSFFLLFVLEYTGREEKVTPTTVALVAVEPMLGILAVWTNPIHGQFWRSVTVDPTTASGLAYASGPLLWIHTIYSWLLLVAGTVLLARMFVKNRSVYRWNAAALMFSLFVPWIANVLYYAEVTHVDLTATGFVVTSVTLYASMYYFDLIDLSPVARRSLVEDMNDGMFVVDDDGRVIDVNAAARRILELGDRQVVGQPAEAVFAHVPELYGRYSDVESGTEEVSVDVGTEVRHYRLDVSPLSNERGTTVGRLFTVRDVTERRRRERELERQNEQLEQFASLVSHDLRNPLNVAGGYVSMIEEAADDPIDEYANEVEVSHDRMRRIIDDVLTMAREGQTIEERESIALREIAEEAWRNVETGDAVLENCLNGRVLGDRSRLLQVFENLFRNSVEHGGDDVVVRTGTLGDSESGRVFDPSKNGFYVADDGPGVPPDARTEVFEAGHTTREDGTGLGLSIVSQFVEAHGWDVAVATGSEGGARFEITGTAAGRDDHGELVSSTGQ